MFRRYTMLKVSLDTVNIPRTRLSHRYTAWKGCLDAVSIPWTFLFHRYTERLPQPWIFLEPFCFTGTLCRNAAWTLNIPWTFFHRYTVQKGCWDTDYSLNLFSQVYCMERMPGRCEYSLNLFVLQVHCAEMLPEHCEYSVNLFFPTGTPHGQAPWTPFMPWCWSGQQVSCTWVHLYPPELRQSLCWGTLSLSHGQCRMWAGWSSASPSCQWGRFRVCGPGSSSSPTSHS